MTKNNTKNKISDLATAMNQSLELYNGIIGTQATSQGLMPYAFRIYVSADGKPEVTAFGKKFTHRGMIRSQIKRLLGTVDPIHVAFARDLGSDELTGICNEFLSQVNDENQAAITYLTIMQFSILYSFYEDDRLTLEERTSLLYAIHKQNKWMTEIYSQINDGDKERLLKDGIEPWGMMKMFDEIRTLNNEWHKRNLDIAPYFLYQLD